MSINKNYKKLKPFELFCMNNFPFIDATFDANTYYELLSKVVEYLETIRQNNEITIENVIKLDKNLELLKNYVNTYFDNLDIQTEINNKLDSMAESGLLQDIILNYVTVTKVYDTYELMIEDLNESTLETGMRLKTLGYHTLNDGGNAIYYLTNLNSEKIGYTIPVKDNYSLVLVNNGTINVKQLGAYGNGTLDDSESFQIAVDNFENIEINEGTYLLNSSISIERSEQIVIYGIGDNSIIKVNSNIYAFDLVDPSNKIIKDLYFDINNGGAIIKTSNSTNKMDLKIKNIRSESKTSTNVLINVKYMHHVFIEDCYLVNRSTDYKAICVKLDGVVNGRINNNTISYFGKGVYITNTSTFTNEGIIISNNLLYQNDSQIISDNTNNLLYYNINNNTFDFCEEYGIKLQNVESSQICNNYFGINNDTCNTINIRQINSNHTDLSINENNFINYKTTMSTPFIKINETTDNNQSGLKINNNGATGFYTFAEINKVSYGTMTGNTSTTSISPNNYLTGDSINNMLYKNNQNGGGAKYLHSNIGDNSNIYGEYEDVKSLITHNVAYKPDASNGFYLYITFANTTDTDLLFNLFLSKSGSDSLLIGNQTLRGSGYQNISIYVPAGYSFKYNTGSPSSMIIQNAHVIY